MNKKQKFLVYMSFYEIPNKKQEELLEVLEDFSLSKAISCEETRSVLSADELSRLEGGISEQELDSAIENMERRGIQIVTVCDDEYPTKLRDLNDRPMILYAKGDLSLLEKQCFAIVGTRSPTAYGKIITEKFATKLAQSGLVIVSGLCYGVDCIGHRATLNAGGKTVAVIGSGFNHIYPAVNTSLAREIVESGGLVMTEYPPSFGAKKYTFPRRNRIVAGLSDGVLITEAGLKSGTTHTKEFALEYGKDLFAVPGNVNSEKSALTNQLIRSAQAECVLDADDILEFYGLKATAKQKKIVELSFEEHEIVKNLENGEQSFDYLAEKTGFSANFLNSCLTTLEIRGLIRKLPAQMYGLIN